MNKIALELQGATEKGAHTLDFVTYENVGKLTLDGANSVIDTLILRRQPDSDSDGMIRIDAGTTLLELKNMPGPVIIKGLAFQLMANSVLLAGSDTQKPNHNLILDSCTIYADTLDNLLPFFSWYATNASAIEFRNTYIVVKGSRAGQAKMSLVAGEIRLANNLFNFQGLISGAVTKKVEVYSNTFNRTQVALNGSILDGVRPTYVFNQNLMAHHGSESAFGGSQFWFANINGFLDLRSSVANNRMYDSWTGFDEFSNSQFTKDLSNSRSDPTSDGKLASELWDWYTEKKDPLTGLLSGESTRSRYNVLPGTRSFAFPLANAAKDTLGAFFQSANFPRNIRLVFNSESPKLDSSLRNRFPTLGSLYFGPFRIDSLTMNSKSKYGKPVLLAKDAKGAYIQQANSSQSAISVFKNGLLASRAFILADSGNTPSGTSISLNGRLASQFDINYRARIAKVDTAGQTSEKDFFNTNFPAEYRYLGRSFGFSTTASINSSVTFGSTAVTPPFRAADSAVYWFLPPKTVVKAVKEISGPDAGFYMAKVDYNSALGAFDAYLVEKLSAPRGITVLPLSEGFIRIVSEKGFQITVDSAAVFDTTLYGQASRGYRFAWTGRGDKDSVILFLKGKAAQSAYVKDGEKVEVRPTVTDTAKNFQINLAGPDTGRTFFLAVKNNILANKTALGTIEGVDSVSLTRFISSTSGRLAIRSLARSFLDSSIVSGEPELANTRFLGGKVLTKMNVNPINKFGMIFDVAPANDSSKVEAWAFDEQAGKWARIQPFIFTSKTFAADSVPTGTEIVLVVERLQDPATYVTATPRIEGGFIVLNPSYSGDLQPLSGYCFQVRSIAQAGTVTTTDCERKPIGEPTRHQYLPNQAYNYRIRYYMGADSSNAFYETLKTAGWDLKAIANFPEYIEAMTLSPERWHLIGFQGAGRLSNYLEAGGKPASTIQDTTILAQFNPSTVDTFETLANPMTRDVTPGQGYLFASSRGYRFTFDSVSGVPEPKSMSMVLRKSGWNFIANPFPMRLATEKITSSAGHAVTFYQLDYDRRVDPKDPSQNPYGWSEVKVLHPFQGYVYFGNGVETLTFDPWAVAPLAKAAMAGGETSSPKTLRASLKANDRVSGVKITSDPFEINIPFLATPGASVQFRVGGRSGYMIKKVSDLSSLDEPVEIRAPKAGRASFSLAFQDTGSAPAEALHFRLVDLVSGRIYDEAEAADLPLHQGSRSYRLLAGDQAFLSERTQGLLAGAPGEIGLSQNFPNPFRGKTQVALDWPAWQNGDRRARLEVLDMQGRTVTRLDIRDIRVGRQLVTLDASAWRPGLYLYRLTVVTAGRQARLQKRMLVSP